MTYFVARDGETFGELDAADFRAQVIAGTIRSDDYYWTEEMAEWKPVSDWRRTSPTVKMVAMPESSAPMAISSKALAEVPQEGAGRRKVLLMGACVALIVIAAVVYFVVLK